MQMEVESVLREIASDCLVQLVLLCAVEGNMPGQPSETWETNFLHLHLHLYQHLRHRGSLHRGVAGMLGDVFDTLI